MKFRQTWTAIRAVLIFSCVLGVGYPLAITAVGQLALNGNANGQLLQVNGETVGSAIIGQSFVDAGGAALPEWFQSRPSAAGAGYDGGASSGSNYGPEKEELVTAIRERQEAIRELDGAAVDDIPAEAVTASASGLDPHISPGYARLQVARVAEARGLDEAEVADLVESVIQPRDLGYLGEPTVNVVQLNSRLAELG